MGTNNVAIIDRAQLPGGPFKPSLKKNLQIWLLLGLVAAALAIALFEILDDTFKSPEEIEEQLGLAVLGIIPFSDQDILSSITDHQATWGRPFVHFAPLFSSPLHKARRRASW